MNTPTFACDLSALTDDQRQRHVQLYHWLTDLRLDVRELDDGYAFDFAADPSTYPIVAEFMALEHLCCPFFRLALEIEPGGKTIALRITGTEGVKDFVYAEFLS